MNTPSDQTEEPDTKRAADEYFLRFWLSNRDTPCPLCGYNLRGLTLPRCPECGLALRLSVSLAEPHSKPWIALIVALLLPAGVGFFLIIWLLHALSHGEV